MTRLRTYFTAGILMATPALAQAQNPIQISLATPIQIVPEAEAVTGFRLNLIYGSNSQVVGLDIGLVNRNTGGTSKGLQYGLVGIVEGGFQGWQDNFVNLVDGRFAGFQSGGYNHVGSGEGVQIGLVNNVRSFSGLQLSLVNYAHDLNGLQIGLINIIKSKDSFPVLPLVNWKFDRQE